jgi:hypothetical protein
MIRAAILSLLLLVATACTAPESMNFSGASLADLNKAATEVWPMRLCDGVALRIEKPDKHFVIYMNMTKVVIAEFPAKFVIGDNPLPAKISIGSVSDAGVIKITNTHVYDPKIDPGPCPSLFPVGV